MKKTNSGAERTVMVKELPIALDQFVKFSGLTGSGGDAKAAVQNGQVTLNGVVETRRGKKLAKGDKVTFGGQTVVVQI